MGNKANKGFESLKDVLASLKGPQGLPFDLRDCEIWRVWNDVVGDGIASNARPVEIKGGCLTIAVKEPIWLQELKYQADDIKQRLNDCLGREAICSIRLKLLNRKAL